MSSTDSGELFDLYREVLLDHSKRPRHRGRPEAADREAEGYNPLCGDRIRVYLAVTRDTIDDAGFDGEACAVCTASASVMTDAVIGATNDEARALFDRFRHMLAGDESRAKLDDTELAAFGGVRRFPMRVKCATLPWHTLIAAINGTTTSVSTEA
ncbi:MAG: Fe-S cluster assembly sulfur transfer protein SufU [Phycisphaerales bacterium]